MVSYVRRTYLVRAGEDEELAVAGLLEAGTLGVEVAAAGEGRVRLQAYFHAGVAMPPVALPEGAVLDGEAPVEDEDWLAAYRARARPVEVGRRFVVDPREPGEQVAADSGPMAGEAADGRWLLRLPARSAFGTGSHESTQLAVELLEEVAAQRGGGLRVLDVGTGTGILSFAALRLGAGPVVAFDSDPVAAFHARENCALNSLTGARAPRLFAGRVDALASLPPPLRFDLVLVNALPDEILPELPAIVARLAAGGELILSGLLAERSGEVLDQLAPLVLAERSRRISGEWAALRLGHLEGES